MRPPSRAVAALLAVVLPATLAPGCTRMKVLPEGGDAWGRAEDVRATAPAVSFAAWADLGDARDHEPFDGDVLTELWLERDGREEIVWRGLGTRWEMELVPGEYRLQVLEVYEDGGSREPDGQNEVRFTLQEGERADVRLLVEQVPWGVIVAVGAAVVVVTAVIVAVAVQREAPRPSSMPRRPPLPRRAPRPHVLHPPVIVVIGPPRIWIPLTLWVDAGPNEEWDMEPRAAARAGPAIERMSVPGADHPDGEVRVVFTRALDPFTVAPDAIHLIGPNGRVPAGLAWEDDTRSAVLRPLRPLPEGSYELRITGRMLQDRDGRPVERNVKLPFTIGGAVAPLDAGLLAP